MKRILLAFFLCTTIMCSSLVPALASGPVAAPANLTAESPEIGKVVLHWTDNSTTETGFAIERKSGSDDTYFQIDSVGSNVTSYEQSEMSTYAVFPGEKYYYRVKAYNDSGSSGYSNEVNIEVKNYAATPAVPAELRVKWMTKDGVFGIQLFWADKADNEDKYLVQRKKAGGTFEVIEELPADSFKYFDTDPLVKDVIYTYRVMAHNNGGVGTSNTADIMIASTMPNIPWNFKSISKGSSSIQLTWEDKANNEDGYKIWRAKYNPFWGTTYDVVASTQPNVTTWTDTGLAPDRFYEYYITVYNAAGENNSVKPITQTRTGPKAPKITLLTKISSHEIKVSWSMDTTVKGFVIERKKSGGSWAQIAEVGPNQRTYNDAALQPNAQYYYRIRTWNTDAYNVRCYSDYSTVVGQKTMGQTTYSAKSKIPFKKPAIKITNNVVPKIKPVVPKP
ncbi:MAG: fibronectin type III domain-containing protein [Acidobacteriota bacterium]